MRADAQPIKKTLMRETREQQIERLIALLGEVQKARPDGPLPTTHV
jgi:hypothetical protein